MPGADDDATRGDAEPRVQPDAEGDTDALLAFERRALAAEREAARRDMARERERRQAAMVALGVSQPTSSEEQRMGDHVPGFGHLTDEEQDRVRREALERDSARDDDALADAGRRYGDHAEPTPAGLFFGREDRVGELERELAAAVGKFSREEPGNPDWTKRLDVARIQGALAEAKRRTAQPLVRIPFNEPDEEDGDAEHPLASDEVVPRVGRDFYLGLAVALLVLLPVYALLVAWAWHLFAP